MKLDLRAHSALFIVTLIYGLNYSVAKGVMPDYIQPHGFILVRVLGAIVLFWGFHAFARQEKIQRKDIPRLLLCGLTGVAANQLLFFSGLNLSNPINSSIMITFIPIAVILASVVLLKERVRLIQLLGITLGLVGVLFQILWQVGDDFSLETGWGDLLVLLNAASYGIYLVLVKPLMAKYSPFTVIKWVFLFGLLFVFPIGIGQFMKIDWVNMPGPVMQSVAFVVIGTSFLAYGLNIFALKRVRPAVVGIYTYLQPVLAAVFAFFLRDESLSWVNLVSAALIFAGVFLVSKKPVTAPPN